MKANEFTERVKPLSKESILRKNSRQEIEELDADDVRAMLLFDKVVDLQKKWKLYAAREGCENYLNTFKMIYPVRFIIWLLVVFSMAFGQPVWCKYQNISIDATCEKRVDNVIFVRSFLHVSNSRIANYGAYYGCFLL